MTTIQALATLLSIEIGRHEGGNVFQTNRGGIIRIVGPVLLSYPKGEAPVNALTLSEAVWFALRELPENDECRCLVLPLNSERRDIYMEIEQETIRQGIANGEEISVSIASTDPRDAISMLMDQLRDCATSLTIHPRLVTAIFRHAVLAVAAYQWVIKWVATLQIKPLEDRIAIPNARIHLFQTPPKEIPIPPPLKPDLPAAEPALVESGFDEPVAVPEFYTCPACELVLHEAGMPIGEPCPGCGEPRKS